MKNAEFEKGFCEIEDEEEDDMEFQQEMAILEIMVKYDCDYDVAEAMYADEHPEEFYGEYIDFDEEDDDIDEEDDIEFQQEMAIFEIMDKFDCSYDVAEDIYASEHPEEIFGEYMGVEEE